MGLRRRSVVGGGGDDAVRRLFELHAQDLYRYAARRSGTSVAEDVVAETFRRVIEHADRFDSERGSPRAWLFGVASNVMRNHYRSERRRIAAIARERARVVDGGDPLLDVPGRVDAERDVSAVLEAAASLDEEDFELLVLVVWEELSSVEVAEALGIAPGTVRSRLHRVRQRLSERRDEILVEAPMREVR